MYISALPHALGTSSEFSSIPILVADELYLLNLCTTIPRGIPFYRYNPLSPEQSSHNCDLAIRVATTHNTLRVDRIASNLAEDVDLGRDTSILEPAPRMSPNIPTTSFHALANAMDTAVTPAPPPIYALQHPLGLTHNIMPFVGGQYADLPDDLPIQITSTVATAITTTAPTSALQQWA